MNKKVRDRDKIYILKNRERTARGNNRLAGLASVDSGPMCDDKAEERGESQRRKLAHRQHINSEIE